MVLPAALFDLTGRVAIVTGSTKGIGRAMVEGLAAAGASVVVSSRKQELCDAVAEEIGASTGADVLPLACHVGEWDRIPAFVGAVRERFGRIDVLVNNAGISPARMTPTDVTLEYWRKVFSVNVEGPLRTSQCVFATMREQGARHVECAPGEKCVGRKTIGVDHATKYWPRCLSMAARATSISASVCAVTSSAWFASHASECAGFATIWRRGAALFMLPSRRCQRKAWAIA